MKHPNPHRNDDDGTEIDTRSLKSEELTEPLGMEDDSMAVELVMTATGRIDALIEKEVITLAEKCRLFQYELDDVEEALPLVHRNEVMTGRFLGNGAFSECYQVWGFQLSHTELGPMQDEARHHLNEMAVDRHGQCNYVMKHLRRDLYDRGPKKMIHAAADLVLEAKFLSHIDHHNIIKLRGWAGEETNYHYGNHDNFFLVLDRLDLTLAHRLLQWQLDPESRDAIISNKLGDFREKVDVAFQIASGLEYLHDRDIIFRDLKPDNIGFRGSTIKLFDFGLCRELPQECPREDQVFHMSGVGTKRYMAPEVFLGQHYNLKADVYSWSIVFHSMLSLEKPFEHYDAIQYKNFVCIEDMRPPICSEWPAELQQLCRRGWAPNQIDRSTIKEIRQILGRLNRKIVVDEEEANKNVVEKSLDVVDDVVGNICSADCFCKDIELKNANGTNILRIMERQMMKSVSTPYRQQNTSYPNFQHLRSQYL